MRIILHHIISYLAKKGIQLSIVRLKILSINKISISKINICKNNNNLKIDTLILHLSILQSLLNCKLIGEVKLCNLQLKSQFVSNNQIQISSSTILCTLSLKTKLLLIEIENKFTVFLQILKKKDCYQIYIETKDVVWNDLAYLMREHLSNNLLKESFSENKFSIFINALIPKNIIDITPFFNATIIYDNDFSLIKKSNFNKIKSKIIIDENFLLNIYKQKYTDNISYITLEKIPNILQNAVIDTEDPNFWNHSGFCSDCVGYAIQENIIKKKFARGASTITMQLVKNLLLSQDRVITRKIEEIIISLLLENIYKIRKAFILELYLNIIEFAPTIYGVYNASYYYFGKKMSDLSFTEILVLTYIIPRPIFFEEALIMKTRQLKINLYNHIKRYSEFMYRRNQINVKTVFEDDIYIIQFAPPFGLLNLKVT